jgi:predicted secreted protein
MAENGTALLVSVGGTQLSCQTESSTLNFTRDLIETTCKDAAGSAKTFIAGEKGNTLDVTAAYVIGADHGFSEMFAIWDAGTISACTWGSVAAGEKSYTFNAIIGDMSIDGPQNDRATYSLTLTITGEVTEVTNPT